MQTFPKLIIATRVIDAVRTLIFSLVDTYADLSRNRVDCLRHPVTSSAILQRIRRQICNREKQPM